MSQIPTADAVTILKRLTDELCELAAKLDPEQKRWTDAQPTKRQQASCNALRAARRTAAAITCLTTLQPWEVL